MAIIHKIKWPVFTRNSDPVVTIVPAVTVIHNIDTPNVAYKTENLVQKEGSREGVDEKNTKRSQWTEQRRETNTIQKSTAQHNALAVGIVHHP